MVTPLPRAPPSPPTHTSTGAPISCGTGSRLPWRTLGGPPPPWWRSRMARRWDPAPWLTAPRLTGTATAARQRERPGPVRPWGSRPPRGRNAAPRHPPWPSRPPVAGRTAVGFPPVQATRRGPLAPSGCGGAGVARPRPSRRRWRASDQRPLRTDRVDASPWCESPGLAGPAKGDEVTARVPAWSHRCRGYSRVWWPWRSRPRCCCGTARRLRTPVAVG
jgi:hypothetical protein